MAAVDKLSAAATEKTCSHSSLCSPVDDDALLGKNKKMEMMSVSTPVTVTYLKVATDDKFNSVPNTRVYTNDVEAGDIHLTDGKGLLTFYTRVKPKHKINVCYLSARSALPPT